MENPPQSIILLGKGAALLKKAGLSALSRKADFFVCVLNTFVVENVANRAV